MYVSVSEKKQNSQYVTVNSDAIVYRAYCVILGDTKAHTYTHTFHF